MKKETRKVINKDGLHLFFLTKGKKFVPVKPAVTAKENQLLKIGTQIHRAPAGDANVGGYHRVFHSGHGNNLWIPDAWVKTHTEAIHLADNGVESFLILDQPEPQTIKIMKNAEGAQGIVDTVLKAGKTVAETTSNIVKNAKDGAAAPTKEKTVTVAVPGVLFAGPVIGLVAGLAYSFYKKDDLKGYVVHALAGFGIGSAPLVVYTAMPKKDSEEKK